MVLLNTATIIELAIMILLIIEFLLMSRFLNNILSEEQKKMTELKNNLVGMHAGMNFNEQTGGNDEDDEKKLDELIPERNERFFEKIRTYLPSRMMLTGASPRDLKMTKGIVALRRNFWKIAKLRNKLDEMEVASKTQE